MQQAVEQGEASAHEDPAQRDVIWKEWARREYETVALPSTPPLPDLETHTEEDVVTFLSEVSGKDIAVLYQELRDTINRYPSRIVSEHLTQMLSNTGNWRALPEYVDWAAWVNAEYEKLSVLSPGPLPDLEENSVDQVLTFLSEAFGRDPETYKGVLFQRFKSAVLARDGGMISPETMERTRLLSREIDSIFWGDGWAKWANERCTTSMRRVRLGAQEAWIRGGIRYFEEINRFRGGDTDRRRRDFIIKQIIPALVNME